MAIAAPSVTSEWSLLSTEIRGIQTIKGAPMGLVGL